MALLFLSIIPPRTPVNTCTLSRSFEFRRRRKLAILTPLNPPKPPVPPDPPPDFESESILTGSLHLRSAVDHIEPTTILTATVRQYRYKPGSPPLRSILDSSENPSHNHYNDLKVFSSVTQDKILQATTSSTTALLEVQPSQPPANTICNDRNVIFLVVFFFAADDKLDLPQRNPRRISLFPAENQMGLGQLLWVLGLGTCKLPKPIMEMRYSWMNMSLTDYFSTTMTFASYAVALALKAAIEAASHIEIHHLRVISDSQSLVSQIISDSDVNELKSVLQDIQCLLETFSFIYVSFILRMANVKAVSASNFVMFPAS